MNLSLRRRAHYSAGLVAAACAVLFIFAPAKYHFYPVCPFFAATHLLCPGCGGTRALHELLHLRLSAAWHLNALVTLCAPVAIVWFSLWYYSVVRHGRGPDIVVPRFAVALAYVITFLFAIVRNTAPLFRF